jgi:outer membrane protein assembly factor BamA
MPRAIPRQHFLLAFAALCCAPPGAVTAQQTEDEPPEAKRSGLIPIPVLYYTPETRLAFGVAAQYYYRPAGAEPTARPSTLTPVFIYTTNGQITAESHFDLWWGQEDFHFTGYAGYSKFPDRFYGVGNDNPLEDEEDYTPRYMRLRGSIERRLFSALRFGIGYQFEQNELDRLEEGGLLDQGDILGSEGGAISGAALLASWDTRDNIFAASHGQYHQLTVELYGGTLGSDYGFGRYELDLRGYIRMLPNHVLAVQGYFGFESGDPPFQQLFRFGGQDLMRGYYQGRFRDKNMIVVQAEYRIVPVWWRLGAVVFGGLGDVADEPRSFALGDLKYSIGGGLRFLLVRAEGITLRCDFGFGEGDSGFYITLGEAF